MGKLRKSISQVDNKFVEELRGDKGRSIMKEGLGAIGEKGSKGEVDLLGLVVGAILGMRLIFVQRKLRFN